MSNRVDRKVCLQTMMAHDDDDNDTQSMIL